MSATGSVLLDTTVVVDHLRGKNPSIAQKLKGIGTLYLPLTALGELLYGAYNSAFHAKGLKQVEDFLRICAVLGPDERTAHIYGRIKADLSQKGKPIPQNDVWIAAVAIEHNLPLATRDPHFAQVAGLTVVQW
jgi:tRNA(fMet)-specific endonuclease VapC